LFGAFIINVEISTNQLTHTSRKIETHPTNGCATAIQQPAVEKTREWICEQKWTGQEQKSAAIGPSTESAEEKNPKLGNTVRGRAILQSEENRTRETRPGHAAHRQAKKNQSGRKPWNQLGIKNGTKTEPQRARSKPATSTAQKANPTMGWRQKPKRRLVMAGKILTGVNQPQRKNAAGKTNQGRYLLCAREKSRAKIKTEKNLEAGSKLGLDELGVQESELRLDGLDRFWCLRTLNQNENLFMAHS
jgi:hypothetical protein